MFNGEVYMYSKQASKRLKEAKAIRGLIPKVAKVTGINRYYLYKVAGGEIVHMNADNTIAVLQFFNDPILQEIGCASNSGEKPHW